MKPMASSIVGTRAVTGGAGTHADVHVAPALDGIGGLLGTDSLPTTPAGYASLLGWLQGLGTVSLVGIEGTGSYGAGLARYMAAAGVRVVEVDRCDRQERRRNGNPDELDAVSAARAAQSGRARLGTSLLQGRRECGPGHRATENMGVITGHRICAEVCGVSERARWPVEVAVAQWGVPAYRAGNRVVAAWGDADRLTCELRPSAPVPVTR
jgi:hypothetical protein